MVVVMLVTVLLAMVVLTVFALAVMMFVVMMIVVVAAVWRHWTAIAAVVVRAVSRTDQLRIVSVRRVGRVRRVVVRVATLLHLAMASASSSAAVNVLFACYFKTQIKLTFALNVREGM
jgi:hypothetical protein